MKDCDCLNASFSDVDEGDAFPVTVIVANNCFAIACEGEDIVSKTQRIQKSYSLDGVYVSPEKYKKCFDELWKRLEGGGSTVSAILSFIACILAEEDQEEPAPPTPPPAPGYTPGSWRRC